MRNIYTSVLLLLIFGFVAQADLLVDGSFESGNLSNWNYTGTVSIANPEIGPQEGSSSLLLIADGGVSQVNQVISGMSTFAALPGEEFNLSGYFLTELDLSKTGFTVGMFKIVFQDRFGNHLIPESVSIGSLNSRDAPGAESQPILNDISTKNTWIFSETQAVAPAETESVQFLALNIALHNASISGMYFDNLTAVRIPETSAFALCFGILALTFVICHRRRKMQMSE